MTDIGPGTYVQVVKVGHDPILPMNSVWLVAKAWEDKSVLPCSECDPEAPNYMCVELVSDPGPHDWPYCGCIFRPWQGPEQEPRKAENKAPKITGVGMLSLGWEE